jgi:lysophospholipase L1-like esterase
MSSHQPVRYGQERPGSHLPISEPIYVEDIEIPGKIEPIELSPMAKALRRPNIAVIGPSDVKPGHIAKELERILREYNQDSVSKSYGIGGQDSALILKRFKAQVVENGHNIVVISGLTIVNEAYPKNIYENYPKMFDMARESGIPVVVYGPTPFAGMGKWKPWMQKKSDAFNKWLKQRDSIIYVDTSSLGLPKFPGGPLMLKKQFDSGDGIHPSEKGGQETARLIFETALKPHLPQSAISSPADLDGLSR